MLLDVITDYMPSPNDERAKRGFRNEDDNIRKIYETNLFLLLMFRNSC